MAHDSEMAQDPDIAHEPEMAHSLQLAELLESQRQTASMTDVVLVCADKDFPAHKVVLCATNSYFRSVLSPVWDERKSTRIVLPPITTEEIEIILPFLYTGKFKDVDDQHLLKALLATTHTLQIYALFECCYKKLLEGLSCSSFLEMCNLAFRYKDKGMTSRVLSFLAKNFAEVAVSEEFLKLNVSQMQKICQHPDIPNLSMDMIINGLFRWAEVDEGREKTLLQLLTTLDLQYLSTDFLSHNLRKRALVKKNYHILTLLTAEATSKMLTLCSHIPSNSIESKLLIFSFHDHRQVLSTYDIKRNQWSVAKILPFSLEHGMSVVRFGNYVFVVGGGTPSNYMPSARILKYCPLTNTVALFGKLAEPVCSAGTGVLSDNIYVVNGIDESGQVVSTVQRYNPVTGICETLARTNNPHERPYVLSYNLSLFIAGFWKDENSIERYDPACDIWTLITAVPGKTNLPSAAVYKEKLFLLPTQEACEFHVYDLLAGTWEQKPFEALASKICRLYSVKFEGKYFLLVLDKEGVLHYFDPESTQWFKKSEPNDERYKYWQTCITYSSSTYTS